MPEAGDRPAAGLAEGFHGDIVAPGDPRYDDARKVWNGSIDRRPALIARPTGVADVVKAVRFAHEHDLLVAVRGGGHSIAGHSTCDGGLVIDLGAMKGVWLDLAARRARVQPGIVWKELDRETQEFGLAVTGGLISSTGVAGFTLGGGIGYLHRRCGLACDNLVSAEVVTADGSFVRASEDENPDLLWAVRGGGGNFGIVTSFELALHPVGPQIVGGLLFYGGDRLPDVLGFFRDFYAEAPETLILVALARLAPPAPFLPEHVHGRPIVVLGVGFAGPPGDEAERVLAPLRALGTPIADLVGPRPYVELQSLLDAAWTPGLQNYWKAEYLSALPDAAIEVLADHLQTITSPLSDFKLPYLGGAVSRVGEDDTAYGHRDAPFIVNINARWTEPQDADRHTEWARSLWRSVQPWSAGGTYTNFMSADDGDRVPDSYGPAKYARLAGIKARYDPGNFFRLNQNIVPATALQTAVLPQLPGWVDLKSTRQGSHLTQARTGGRQ
jgi:FAD/FMN-containing dehydrogenase